MVKNITRVFMFSILLFSMIDPGYSMSRPPSVAVPVDFIRIAYEKTADAIVIEFVVPGIEKIKNISRIEMLICNTNDVPVFGLLHVCGNRCAPVPPGSLGVIIDPSSEDREITNIQSIGPAGSENFVAPGATILEQSSTGTAGGNLGLNIWIAPKDWKPRRYLIKTRIVQRKRTPSIWQKLVEFDYTGAGVENILENSCLINPVFTIAPQEEKVPSDSINSLTLIRYDRQPLDEVSDHSGGETAVQYRYVETGRRELKGDYFHNGLLLKLERGFYQFKHNSVRGNPPSGFYGESAYFEADPKREIMNVKILLYPAI